MDTNTEIIENKLYSIGHGAGKSFLDSFFNDDLSTCLSGVNNIETLLNRLGKRSSNLMRRFAQLANTESDIKKLSETLALIASKQTHIEQPFKTLYEKRNSLTTSDFDETILLIINQLNQSYVFRKFKEKLMSPLKLSKLETFTILLFLFIFEWKKIK